MRGNVGNTRRAIMATTFNKGDHLRVDRAGA